MDWYCIVDGAQRGPLSEDELRAFVAEGTLGPSDLVWNASMGAEWKPVSSVSELTPPSTLSADLPAPPERFEQTQPTSFDEPVVVQATGNASCTAAAGEAWRKMKVILFKPFDFGKWFVLGFSAFLATLGAGGGSGSYSSPGDLPIGENARSPMDDMPDFNQGWEQVQSWFGGHGQLIILLIALVVLLVVVIGLVLLWIKCRGKFVFLDNCVMNRAAIREPWGMFREHAASLFKWSILFGLASLAVTVLLLGVTFLSAVLPCIQASGFTPAAVPGIIISAILWVLYIIAVSLIAVLLEDFIVPLMYRKDCTTMEAWHAFRALSRGQVGSVIVYLLLRAALSMASSACVLILVLVTCCVAGCIMAIPVLGSVLLLPISVFFRLYAVEFLGQFSPELDFYGGDEPATAAVA